MFLLLRHETNVIYLKLVNNPFNRMNEFSNRYKKQIYYSTTKLISFPFPTAKYMRENTGIQYSKSIYGNTIPINRALNMHYQSHRMEEIN